MFFVINTDLAEILGGAEDSGVGVGDGLPRRISGFWNRRTILEHIYMRKVGRGETGVCIMFF